MGLVSFFVALFSLLGAVVLGLVKDEIAAWLPILARRLIRSAARKLPADRAERYEEEWLAHLEDCPGRLGQLWHALGVWRTAVLVARADGSMTTRIDVKLSLIASALMTVSTASELFYIKYDVVPWVILVFYGLSIAGSTVALGAALKLWLSGVKYVDL